MKKLISLFLCLCICLNLFSGCNLFKKKDGPAGPGGMEFEEEPGNTLFGYLGEYKRTANLSGLTARGLPPETPKTGPANDWNDVPVPGFNPLGSRELYDSVNYYRDSEMTYAYLVDNTEISRNVKGENWQLNIKEGEGDILPFLRGCAEKLGAQFLDTASDDSLVFTVREKDAVHFCAVETWEGGIRLKIIKQLVFEVNKTYTITQNMYTSDNYQFLADLPGEKFTTIRCGLPNGTVWLEGKSAFENGSMQWTCNYYAHLYSNEYKEYTLYDFPQDPGLYEFRLGTINNDPLPSSFTIEFRETEYELPGYKPGGLGALVVKNVPPGKVFALTQGRVQLHDKLNDRRYDDDYNPAYGVPSGDDLWFSLPAGYYTLVEERGYSGGSSARTQLVPVSAGEQTTLTLPDSWKAASEMLGEGSDDRPLTGSIKISKMTDKTQTAELALSVSDPFDRDVFPTKENTVITEGGKEVKIVDIKREILPCSIALVIDSSGSMKNDMKPTLDAARKFIESLPDGTYIKLIDFSTKVVEHKGTTKQEALKNLSAIKASGYTTLYDAAVLGTQLVKGKDLPAVVLFTDGVDSREDPKDQEGTGSSIDREGAADAIREARVPVYTIGYGKRLNEDEELTQVEGAPDVACLIEFSSISGGEYYPAKQPDALDAVFTAISSKLGNNFVITYERPTESNISDTPVYSFMIDCSGSMSMSPEENEVCGFRMENAKQLVSDAIAKLPEGAITQLATYQGGFESYLDISYKQMSTTDKAALQKAVGYMQAGGGTPILDALTAAYENVVAVPTSKRVIVFVTDSGLETELQDEEMQKEYQKLLARIKDKGIHILWVGMGATKPEWKEAFVKAAAATDGEYVVSESTADIMKALDTLLGKVAKEAANRVTPVTVDLSYKTDQGELVTYKAQEEANFTPPQKRGTPVEPGVIRLETGKKLNAADGPAAAIPLRGIAGLPGVDSKIYGSAEIGKTMSNDAMEMTVVSVAYYDKLMGLEASQNGYRFAAFELELKNATAKKIEYQIPSIFKHFYVGIDGGLYPASSATWLAEKPVTKHGDPSISIPAGGTVAGALVFLVPYSEQGYSQVSLHYYDTDYGHIQMPIAGGALDKWSELEKLPKEQTGKLSDTFSMVVTAAEMKPAIDKYKPGANAAFQVIEGRLDSKVQALLDIKPAERIYLRYPSKSGDLMASLSRVTDFMPFGFSKPAMLGPGSANMVRLAYEAPGGMEKYKSELYFDLADGCTVFGVTEGEAFGAPGPAVEFDTEFVKVRINQLVALQEDYIYNDGDSCIPAGSVLVDATFIDKPDPNWDGGTLIPQDFFSLANRDYREPEPGNATAGSVGLGSFGAASADGLKEASHLSSNLIFGIGDHFGVFGGQSRRALVIFDAPEDSLSEWRLQSKYYENVRADIPEGDFASPELIAYSRDFPDISGFEEELDEAVSAAVRKYAALGGGSYNPVILLEDPNADMKQRVDLPPVNAYGTLRMQAVKTEANFVAAMRGVNCIPKRAHENRCNMAPESVLTQGFGDITSAANTAAVLLARLGFTPEKKYLKLTSQGGKVLEGFYGFEPAEHLMLTGLAYRNAAGERKMFVVPFMADISELAGYVYVPGENANLLNLEAEQSGMARVEVYVDYMARPTDEANVGGGSLWEGLGNAMAGDETGEVPAEKLMLSREFPLDTLSTGAIDIGFVTVPSDRGDRTVGFFGMAQGEEFGAESLPADAKLTGIRTVISGITPGRGDGLTNWNTAPKGARLDEYFLTLGINLPDMPGNAAGVLEAAANDVHERAQEPDRISAFKWYHRMSIYRFIAGQTTGENDMARSMDLVVGRIDEPRCIVMTTHVQKSGGSSTSIDLAQSFNEIHNAESAPEEAVHGFNTMSGFYMCDLERGCLLGDNAVGYLELWSLLPQDANKHVELDLIPFGDAEYREAAWEEMTRRGGYPQPLLDAVKNTDKFIFAPKQAVELNGEKRWAWLEIDPVTYRVISVFDNGQHSGVEASIGHYLGAVAVGTVAGFFIGQLTYMGFYVGANLTEMNDRERAEFAYKSATAVSTGISAASSIFSAGLGVGVILEGSGNAILLDLISGLTVTYTGHKNNAEGIVAGVMVTGAGMFSGNAFGGLLSGFSIGFAGGVEFQHMCAMKDIENAEKKAKAR